MACGHCKDQLTAETFARFASLFRRRAAEATVKAKTTTDAVEKVMLTKSATSADTLASHFERTMAEVYAEKASA